MKIFTLLVSISILFANCNQPKEEVLIDPNLEKKEVLVDSNTEKKEVLEAIINFHNGMRQKDGEMAIASWAETAAGYTISIDSTGVAKKDIESPINKDRLDNIRTWLNETKDNLDEEIFDVQVNVEGELAMAWVPYNFYRNENFSHSGTNAFTLMKFESDWKIISVADTRYFGKKIRD